MKADLLRYLRTETAKWWTHKALRDAGRFEEARDLERSCIRRDVEMMRKAIADPNAYISIGRGGAHLEYSTPNACGSRDRTSCQGYSVDHVKAIPPLLALGMKAIDTRPVKNPFDLLPLPMIAVDREPDTGKIGALSYVSFNDYAKRARALGACIINA